jgi:uncharacterized membrane protein
MATNILDGITSLLLWVLAAISARVGAHGRAPPRAEPTRLAVAALVAIVVAYPFVRTMVEQGRGLGWVWPHSSLRELLTHFGIPLGLLAIGAGPSIWHAPRGRVIVWRATLIGTAAVGLCAGDPVGPIGALVAGLLLALASVARDAPEDRGLAWALMAGTAGVGLVLLCEVVYVPVSFGPVETTRLVLTNKLYLQAWVLMGAANVVLLCRLFLPGSRRAATAVAWVLMALGAFYPVLAPMSHTQFFALPRTLWAGRAVGRDHPELWPAVAWLEARGPRRIVVLEAPGDSYTWHGRLATLTGGVTALAWIHHEASWRNSWDLIQSRMREIDAIYRMELGWPAIEALLDAYGVELVAVGDLERERYPRAALAALTAHLVKVFDAEGLALYHRRNRR